MSEGIVKNLLASTWVIRYDATSCSRQEAWETLSGVAAGLPSQRAGDFYSIDRTGDGTADVALFPGGRSAGARLYRYSGRRLSPAPGQPRPCEERPFELFRDRLKTVVLLMPRLMQDKRWRTVKATASALYLGSALMHAGFHCSSAMLSLPDGRMDSDPGSAHVLGFTLFEDLFPDFKRFLENMEIDGHIVHPLLAAGGPLVTLHPLETAFHLPRLHLLVRGEGESVFPAILERINDRDWPALSDEKGFLLQLPGWMMASRLGEVNRMEPAGSFSFHSAALRPDQLRNGLEVNFSRGCSRSCLFCAKVQGRTFRPLPLPLVENLLNTFGRSARIAERDAGEAATLNINDDDILQDISYAAAVFSLIRKNGLRLWGIQTSLLSLVGPDGSPSADVLDLIDDNRLYVQDRPLIWLGTDVFLEGRARCLGKPLLPPEKTATLLADMERRGIQSYHYWISSDHLSTWQEFIEELKIIAGFKRRFAHFHLLAHAPFVVPYASTPLYRYLIQRPQLKSRIKYRQVLLAARPHFRLPLVERVESGDMFLNRMLAARSRRGGNDFLDLLGRGDFQGVWLTVFDYLKRERIQAEASGLTGSAVALKGMEAGIAEILADRLQS